MSQAERVSRIHFLLTSRGKVTLAELKSEFEVSRATVMRDIELMRDRLFSPITYDPNENAYVYDNQAREYDQAPFELPGVWINPQEAYALLTLLNVSGQMDPGALMPHVYALKRMLKMILAERSIPMKGFHKKIGIDLPNLHPGNRSVVKKMSSALVEEYQAVLTWQDKEESLERATVSIQRFVLGANGWDAEFIVEKTKERYRIPLPCFTACTVTTKPAILLPEFKSDPKTDWEALREIYDRINP